MSLNRAIKLATSGRNEFLALLGNSKAGLALTAMAAFVFRPDGIAGNGVYVTSESLRLALARLDPATPRVIVVDSSDGAAHFTAGHWALNNTTLINDNTTAHSYGLHIDTGCVIDSAYLRIANFLQVSSEAVGTSPLVTSADTQVVVDEQAQLFSIAGAAPFLHVTAAGNFSKLYIDHFGTTVGDAAHNVATVDVGQNLIAIIDDGSNLQDHAVGGEGRLSSHLSPGALLGVQDTGLGAQSLLADSHLVTYTAGDATKWVAPAPTTVQQALDRIAANTTNTHPIP